MLILYYSVKQIIVCEKNVTYISILGNVTTFSWKDVDKVKTSQGRRLTLMNKDGVKFTVGGNKSDYKHFILIALKKIKPEAAEDIIHRIKTALKI